MSHAAQAEALVDLSAIQRNVECLASNTAADVMAVVKANGYGHGAIPAARAAIAGGASWLGVCTFAEAVQLRAAGISVPILAWLHSPGQDWDPPLRHGIDISVGSVELLAELVAAVRQLGIPARVHLKADTGLSRGGATLSQWSDVVGAAAKAAAEGAVEIVGIWSHLACADEPEHPANVAQLAAFSEALRLAEGQGVKPPLRHLANSAASLAMPNAHYDLIRPGISVYGYSPLPRKYGDFGLKPAMTLRGKVMLVKEVSAGQGVSYGHTYHTDRDTTLAVIPMGYADGIPRAASDCGPLLLGGQRHTIAGRVCMDQFVVDLGDAKSQLTYVVQAGDVATVFGPGDSGEPTADDWAEAAGTISYEILVRIGNRVRRVYVNTDV